MPINDFDEINSWAFQAVQTVYSLEIVQGTPQDQFNPLATATRAEAAQVLWRLYMLVKKREIVINSSC